MLVAATLKFYNRHVITVHHVAIDMGCIQLGSVAILFAGYDVKRQVLGVLPIERAITIEHCNNRNHARPEIGMRQTNIPSRVSATRMPGKKHAIGIDGKSAVCVSQAGEYGVVFSGRVIVLLLPFLHPFHGNHDVA
jgi:hypothetical protein